MEKQKISIQLANIPVEKIHNKIDLYLTERYQKSPATLSLLKMFNNKHLYFVTSQSIVSVLLNAYDEGVQHNIKSSVPPLLSFLTSGSVCSGNNLFKTKFLLSDKNEIMIEVEEIEKGASHFFYQIENSILNMKATFKEDYQKEFEKVLIETLQVKFDNCVKYINDICSLEISSSSTPALDINEVFLKKELCIVLGNESFNSECVYLYERIFNETN